MFRRAQPSSTAAEAAPEATAELVEGTEQRLALIRRRLAGMSGEELFSWAESAMNPIGRGVSEARKGTRVPGYDPLGEAYLGAETLLEVLSELLRR